MLLDSSLHSGLHTAFSGVMVWLRIVIAHHQLVISSSFLMARKMALLGPMVKLRREILSCQHDYSQFLGLAQGAVQQYPPSQTSLIWTRRQTVTVENSTVIDRSHRTNVNVTSLSGGQIKWRRYFILDQNFPWNVGMNEWMGCQKKLLVDRGTELYHTPAHGLSGHAIRSATRIASQHCVLTLSGMALCMHILRLFLHCTSTRPWICSNVFHVSSQRWFKSISHLKIQHYVSIFTRHVGEY